MQRVMVFEERKWKKCQVKSSKDEFESRPWLQCGIKLTHAIDGCTLRISLERVQLEQQSGLRISKSLTIFSRLI